MPDINKIEESAQSKIFSRDMDLMIADMEKELTNSKISAGLCFKKVEADSVPNTAEGEDEEGNMKKSIMSARNSATDKESMLSAQSKRSRKGKKRLGDKKKPENELEIDGGPYFEEGKMKVQDYLNRSGYSSMMLSQSSTDGNILKGGPFANIKTSDKYITVGGSHDGSPMNSNVSWGVPKVAYSRFDVAGMPVGASMGFGNPQN